MKTKKHIAMWACPRSRSTVTTRAFENLDGCIVYDEPFLAPYTSITGNIFGDNNLPQLLKQKDIETDYKKVIQKLTGDLPDDKLFSFQKLSTDHYLPQFGIDWAKKLTNFFLLRHPQEILFSVYTAVQKINFTEALIKEQIGIEVLYQVFQQIKILTEKTPLAIHSDDIVKNPRGALQWLCENLGIAFNEKMLAWKEGLEDSNLLYSQVYAKSEFSRSEPWFETLRNSQTFLPYQKKEIDLPEHLIPLLEESMPYYEKLLEHCHIFEWSEHQ